MSDETTIAVYDEKAEEYGRLTETLWELRELEAFSEALPKGGRVLDLGCGPGFYAAKLATLGFEVEAWDASVEMVSMAKAHPGVCAKQARFDDLAGNDVYDGIWANFSLLHAPKFDFPKHLARIRRALKPGGAFHIGMKLGEGEGPDSIGRFYAYYSEEELVELLAAAGFTVKGRRRGEGPGLSGEVSPFMTVLCHG